MDITHKIIDFNNSEISFKKQEKQRAKRSIPTFQSNE